MAGYLPEEHRLAAEQREAQGWQNAANWTLQAAGLGLDIVKTVESAKTQGQIQRQDAYNDRYKEIWAEKIDAGIQPFSEVGGEMEFTQFQELQDLGKEYVEEARKKYGAKAAERAQAYVDGKKIDDYFNAAQMLNKLDIDTIHENSDTALDSAVTAGDFGGYEQWADTVNDPLLKSQLLELAKKEFDYRVTLKSAESAFDTQGIDAARQMISETAYTDKQKEDLNASLANYRSKQMSAAANTAANTFDKTMEATGGGIAASMNAANAAAAEVSRSPEVRRAVEQNMAALQSNALNDSFSKRLIGNEDNAAWLKAESARLTGLGDSGDYKGQNVVRRSHINQLKGLASGLEAKAAAAEAAAKAAVPKAVVETVMPNDVVSQWFQGEMPGLSMNSLVDNILTAENISGSNVRAEDIHARIISVAGKEAPHIASVFGTTERWLKVKFPKFSDKNYSPTEKETDEYQRAVKWAFASEMEIIGNAPFASLNTESGKWVNKLNAALSSKDLGKINPNKMEKTISAMISGVLDDEVSLDPNAGAGTTSYVYPDKKTEENYRQFGQNVANLLQETGIIPNASNVEMKHFPEKDESGRSFGAGGNVYFLDRKTGTKYRAVAKGNETAIQQMAAGDDVLSGKWTDVEQKKQEKKPKPFKIPLFFPL